MIGAYFAKIGKNTNLLVLFSIYHVFSTNNSNKASWKGLQFLQFETIWADLDRLQGGFSTFSQ
jgi:hypothetical protein